MPKAATVRRTNRTLLITRRVSSEQRLGAPLSWTWLLPPTIISWYTTYDVKVRETWLLPPTIISWYATFDAKVRQRGLAIHDNIRVHPVRCDSSTPEDRACQRLQIGSLGGLTTYIIHRSFGSYSVCSSCRSSIWKNFSTLNQIGLDVLNPLLR